MSANKIKINFGVLKAYKRVFGNLHIPANFVVPQVRPWPKQYYDFNLGKYAAKLRTRGINCDLYDKDDIKEVDRIGLNWDGEILEEEKKETPIVTTNIYEGMPDDVRNIISGLLAYRKVFGDMVVPPDFIITKSSKRFPPECNGLKLGAIFDAILNKGYLLKYRKELIILKFPFNAAGYPVIKSALLSYGAIHGDLLVNKRFEIEFGDERFDELTWGIKLGKVVNKIRHGKIHHFHHPGIHKELQDIGFVFAENLPVPEYDEEEEGEKDSDIDNNSDNSGHSANNKESHQIKLPARKESTPRRKYSRSYDDNDNDDDEHVKESQDRKSSPRKERTTRRNNDNDNDDEALNKESQQSRLSPRKNSTVSRRNNEESRSNVKQTMRDNGDTAGSSEVESDSSDNSAADNKESPQRKFSPKRESTPRRYTSSGSNGSDGDVAFRSELKNSVSGSKNRVSGSKNREFSGEQRSREDLFFRNVEWSEKRTVGAKDNYAVGNDVKTSDAYLGAHSNTGNTSSMSDGYVELSTTQIKLKIKHTTFHLATQQPSLKPSTQPSTQVSRQTNDRPSAQPTTQPFKQPTSQPNAT